jgi:hypothetical protein
MPNFARTFFLVLHVSALAVGAVIAGMAVASVIENFPDDVPNVALSRIATAATLGLMTAAYALTLFRRGFTPAAPFLFAASYFLGGFFVDAYGRALAKAFAGAATAQIEGLYLGAVAKIVFALAISFVLWFWTHRKSRFPLF